MPDIFLSEPYLEFDTFSVGEDDPFNRTVFLESLNELLPSPSKFCRPESIPMGACCCRGAIVSLVKPHKILAVAPDVLSLVEFTSDQICGRSVNVLFGPKTVEAPLTAAIKNTGHGQPTTIDTVLSSSKGADLNVTVTFSPYRRASDGSLGGCLLQIDFLHIPDFESSIPKQSSLPVLLLDDVGIFFDPSTSPQPSPKSHFQRRLRREANLATGLENEAERRRQQQGRLLLDAWPASL